MTAITLSNPLCSWAGVLGNVFRHSLWVLLLSGCTVVGPDFEPVPTPELPTSWTDAELSADAPAVTAWWQQFNDDTLNTLIAQGVDQNLSLEAAGLRIVQARAALGISDALLYPQQQQLSGSVSKAYQQENTYNAANIGLDVGWEMDIWGKYTRGIEVSEASLYASIASYHDVMVTITAEIARNYINYRTAQERIFLSQQNIAIQQRVVAMTQVQFDSGNVSELDVQQAKTQLYATQAALPALRIAKYQAGNALAVLLGTIPEQIEPLLAAKTQRKIKTYDERMAEYAADQKRQRSRDGISVLDYDAQSIIPVAPSLSPQIDSALVLRRPDLQVAELSARAQSARIGLTEADLYPQFVLFGSIGLSDSVLSGDSFSGSRAVTAAIGPGFSWNIFQYGRIKNRIRIEDARFQESLTNYNQQVLSAVQEVTNALQAYEYSQQQSEYNFNAVQASLRAFDISATQYNNGLVTYQRLLSTVEKMTLREDTYAQTKGNIANQVVALYKALGGGWQVSTEQAVPLLKPQTIEQMKARTDWGTYLDPEVINGSDRNDSSEPAQTSPSENKPSQANKGLGNGEPVE